MDTFLAIASKRDTRSYAPRPIPEEVARRILDAGRLAGSALNRQPWRFLVVEDAARREMLAQAVYEPGNVRGAQLACPNGIADPDRARETLGLDEPPAVVLTFGYPARHPGPESRPAEEWSARANRRPLDELVERL
jgi:nitroreductase